MTYADDNNDGNIDASSEIRREQNYYPFGLEHKGYNNMLSGVKNNLKTYQKQEFTEDLGLNTHEWKYRVSDPAIGRFWQIDPLAEKYSYNSTYAFQENKLGIGIELEGLEVVDFEDLFSDDYSDAEAESGALGQMSIELAAMASEMGGLLDYLFVKVSPNIKKEVVVANGTGTNVKTALNIEGGFNFKEFFSNYTLNNNGEAEFHSAPITGSVSLKTTIDNTLKVVIPVSPVADVTTKGTISLDTGNSEVSYVGQATLGVKGNGVSVKSTQNVTTGSSKVEAGLSGSVTSPKIGGFSLGLDGFMGIRWTSEED